MRHLKPLKTEIALKDGLKLELQARLKVDAKKPNAGLDRSRLSVELKKNF